jgi:ankyrin repeat protein
MKAADAAPTVAAAGPGGAGAAPAAPATPRVAVAVAPAPAPAPAPAAPKAPAAAGAPVKRDSAPTPPPQTGFNSRGPTYGDLIGNKGGLTALLFAVRDGSDACVARLLEAGAKINHVSEGDHTSPLLMATINGRFDMAKMLLEKGADVKLQSDAGAAPLYATINVQWAAKSLYPQPTAQLQQTTSHLELMEAFLKAGADVNVRLKKHLWFMSYNFDLLGVNTVGATAFWRAAYGTDVPAMKLLVKYGADITIPTIKPSGRLPGDDSGGDDAAAGGKDPSGLDPIPDGGPGVYPIHAATGVGYGEGFAANSHRHAPDAWMASAKYLIEELKVDVNMRDHNGYNAVHHAAARGDNDLITYLASKGGDIMAISRRGQTTVDMANGPVQRIPPFLETVDFLVKMGAKNSNKCKSC